MNHISEDIRKHRAGGTQAIECLYARPHYICTKGLDRQWEKRLVRIHARVGQERSPCNVILANHFLHLAKT